MPSGFICEVCSYPHDTEFGAHACALQETAAPLSGTVEYTFGAAKPAQARIMGYQILAGSHKFIYQICLTNCSRTTWVPEQDIVSVPARLELVSNAA